MSDLSKPKCLARRDLLTLSAGALATSAFACRSAPARAATALDADEKARLDELFADLGDQRDSVEPIQPQERAARRARAGALLAMHGFEAMLVEGGATLAYLSGISWGLSERLFGLVVLADGTFFWVVPAFEEGKARAKLAADPLLGTDVLTWSEDEYAWRPLAAELERRRVVRVCVDPAARLFVADGLADELGRERVQVATRVIHDLRGVKDAHEIAILRRASELTQDALVAAAAHIRPGMRGGEIGDLVQFAQRKLGLSSTWDLSLVGAMAALPHGDDTRAVLAKDQFVLIDTGGSLHGYQSDVTRTWVPDGQPHEAELRAWRAVREAQQRAFEAIRPGVVCATVDHIARESIERAGFGGGYSALTHRLGHGIGMEGHEWPYFDGGSQVVLAPGMILTDEPGIYVVGKFGVRLEDDVAVTGDGADHFGAWQRHPRAPQ